MTHPHLICSSFGVLVLTLLFSTYSMREVDPRLNEPIHQRPSFLQLCSAVLFDKQPAHIEYPPPANAERTEHDEEVVEDIHSSTVTFWMETIMGVESDVAKKEQTWAYQKGIIRAEVDEVVNEGEDSVEERIEKERSKERQRAESTYQRMKGAINPVAAALGPAQQLLAAIVPKVRQAKNALLWSDRILTFWSVVIVAAVTLLLALIPWRFLIFWSARVFGVLVFGPHMHFLGRRIDKRRADERERAREYSGATEARRATMLYAFREELMKAAKVRIDKAQKKQEQHPERTKKRLAFLQDTRRSHFNLVNGNTRGNANIKYIAAADANKSKVAPLATGAVVGMPVPSGMARKRVGAVEML